MSKQIYFEKHLAEKKKNEQFEKKELAATARQRLPPPKKNKIPRTLLEVFGT